MIFLKSIRLKLISFVLMLLLPLLAYKIISIIDNYDKNSKNELAACENLASAVSTSFKNYLDEVFVLQDIIGTHIGDNSNLKESEISSYLQDVFKKQKGLLRISWINTDGIIVACSNEKVVNTSIAIRASFQRIINGDEKVVSDYIRTSTNPPSYYITALRGIYKNGKLLGIVGAVIDAGKLKNRLPFMKMDNTHYILIDRNGIVAYNSKIEKTPDGKTSVIKDASVINALNGNLVKTIKEYSESEKRYNLCVYYPIPEIGWVCKVCTPHFEAMAEHYDQLIDEIIFLAFIFVLVILIALILRQYLLKPAAILTQTAKKIMNGDYSARTNINGQDEMGLVAEAFDKMAESIEQWYSVKGQFFTNISHELKTPLNVMFSSIQLIDSYKNISDKDLYQAKLSNQMKIIRQNCYRIMRLINNLIDISRHDSGFLKIRPRNYNIVKLTRDITLSVKKYVAVKEIELTYESEIESCILACDPDMIERILLNLISNSIKFTDKNGKICVSLKDKDDSILISVSDTGVGIPQDKLNVIFERFKQADDLYTRNHEGSGIGLSLVKAFIEAHGGTITVKSEVNRGSEFIISLPKRLISDIGDERSNEGSAGGINRINIEFSDIYSIFD